jgi:hypothetical protein
MRKAHVTVKNVGDSSATILVYARVIGEYPDNTPDRQASNITATINEGETKTYTLNFQNVNDWVVLPGTMYKGVDNVFRVDDDWPLVVVEGGCFSDDDCKDAGITCENSQPPYPNRYAKCDLTTHKCTLCDPCRTRYDCKDTYCCDKEIDVSFSGQCKPQGDIVPFGGKSYLCDPPNGFTSKAQAKQKSLFEVLFEFLNSWVQNFR